LPRPRHPIGLKSISPFFGGDSFHVIIPPHPSQEGLICESRIHKNNKVLENTQIYLNIKTRLASHDAPVEQSIVLYAIRTKIMLLVKVGGVITQLRKLPRKIGDFLKFMSRTIIMSITLS